MLVAAEASGDTLGAGLARALKKSLGEANVRFIGVGGTAMAAEGVVSPFDINQLSILGLFEGLMAYGKVVARVAETADLARREKPDIAVLIDSWGFTLRVAHKLRQIDPDLPLVKYVAPQVWASRPGRAKTLAASVDHLLAIHTFDVPFFEREGLATTFVGASALARNTATADPGRLRAAIRAGADDPILLMLPGSRPSEIRRVLPPFEEAVSLLRQQRPNLRIVVPAAPTVVDAVKASVATWPFPADLIEEQGLKFDAMAAATVALACSGTVTTELALAGCPVVVGYRIGEISFQILSRLVRTQYITLFNIAAGEAVAPEFIQHACTGPALAAAVAARLDDPALRARQISAQNAALEKMGRGGPDPSIRAAEVVVELLGAKALR